MLDTKSMYFPKDFLREILFLFISYNSCVYIYFYFFNPSF